MRTPSGQAGFTLTELIIGLVVLGVMGMGLVSLFRVQHQTYNRQNEGVLATQNARAGMDMMTREMRNAGFTPYGDAPAGVTVWTDDSFAFTADLNGDGDVADAEESVLYFHDAVDDLLVRASGGVESPLANQVTDLSFLYFSDAEGTAAACAAALPSISTLFVHSFRDPWSTCGQSASSCGKHCRASARKREEQHVIRAENPTIGTYRGWNPPAIRTRYFLVPSALTCRGPCSQMPALLTSTSRRSYSF